jgi:hypothetical protein
MPFIQVPAFNTDCLRSTVKNTSGVAKRFSFLPPNGRLLAIDEEQTFLGTPTEAISRFPGHGKRHLDALERSVLAGELAIVNTPNPILFDPVLDTTSMLVLSGGTLAVEDPCWQASASASVP